MAEIIKPPRSLWNKKVRCELITRDMTYKDLAEAVGTKEGYIRQLLCNTYRFVPKTNPTRVKINDVLDIEEE